LLGIVEYDKERQLKLEEEVRGSSKSGKM
jgi:hypothetical protein